MLRKIAKTLLPAPFRQWLKATGKRYLPTPVKEWLKRNVLGRGGSSLRSRDLMLQILEQRCENLERYLVDRVDGLEETVRRGQLATLRRQDKVLTLFEQRLERFERAVMGADSGSLLSDETADRLQDESHDPERLRDEYSYLIGEFVPEGGRFLDVGCGGGVLLEQAKQSGRLGAGVDLSPTAVATCRGKGLDVDEGEAVTHLGHTPEASFDCIFALHIVEHLGQAQLGRFLREALRVLKPGGVLVAETPKIASLPTLSEYYFVDPTHLSPRHHNLYRFAFEDAGFTEVKLDDVVRTDGPEDLERGFAALVEEGDARRGTAGEGHAALGTASSVDARLDVVAQRLDQNFQRLHELLLVPRDIRIVARKAE